MANKMNLQLQQTEFNVYDINSLNLIDNEEDRNLLLKCLSDETFLTDGGLFISDLKRQWDKYGKLSIRQMSIILKRAKQFYSDLLIADTMIFYYKGEKIFIENAKVVSIEEVETNNFGLTNKVKFVDDKNITYFMKTVSKKFLDIFNLSLKDKMAIDVFAEVCFSRPGKPYFYLSAKSAKVKMAM